MFALTVPCGADRQALRVRDGAFDAALNQKILFGGEVSLEVQRRAEDGGALCGTVVRIAHSKSPLADVLQVPRAYLA